MFRPYTRMFLYFDQLFNNSVYLQQYFFPNMRSEIENAVINVTYDPQIEFSAIMLNCIPCLHVGGRQGQSFPFYVYDDDGTNRRENITDWALGEFRRHYRDDSIGKWDIFHYTYGILHDPCYRERFGANLRCELPRIPWAKHFWRISKAGELLKHLHLDYENLPPYPLEWIETPRVPLSYRVEKMRLSKDGTALTVNQSLTLRGIPPEVFQYRLGNRSAIEWVIDQYQLVTDPRTGIVSDPNRDDDPEHVVRLVGQVIRVSAETTAIVSSLNDRA